MNVLFVASEAVPLAKVGGLADVVGALPSALHTLGLDVRILIPQYSGISDRFGLTSTLTGLEVYCLGSRHRFNINCTSSGGIPVYTLDSPFFSYTHDIYSNELERFYFFSCAVRAALPHLGWQPEIIHCHDWMTAPLVMLLRQSAMPYRTLFSIHNLNHPGFYDRHPLISRELGGPSFHSPAGSPVHPACFLADGILWADGVNTVSETYAREITTPEQGAGLDSLLRFRGNQLQGIPNGIDYAYWNPQTDPYINVKYSSQTLTDKVKNKVALQNEMGLPADPDVPLIGMVQRLDEQKGLDIFLEGLDNFLRQTPVQIVLQGKGRQDYQDRLLKAIKMYPDKIAAIIAYDEALAHRIYAASDLYLMPSRFEPCGLSQMIAVRYGVVPVVRHTGGLVDSILPFNADFTAGRGFVFHDYSTSALYNTLGTALRIYYNRKLWMEICQRISRTDFSWPVSARRYAAIYRQLTHSNE